MQFRNYKQFLVMAQNWTDRIPELRQLAKSILELNKLVGRWNSGIGGTDSGMCNIPE